MEGYKEFKELSQIILGSIHHYVINDKVYEKVSYYGLLRELDNGMDNFLKKTNYSPDNRKEILLFSKTDDERLSEAVEKSSKIKEHPEYGIGEAVALYEKYMQSFLDKYYLGWLREFNCQQSVFLVKIGCSLHPSTVSQTPVSAKNKFEKQLAYLESIGIELFDWRRGRGIKASQRSLDTIKKLISDRGAKHISFKIQDEAIEDISFYVNVKDIKNFETQFEEETIPKSDILTEDDIANFKKNYADFFGALNMLEMENMFDTCGYLIRSCFSEICKMFNFSGIISEGIEMEHKSSREKNLKIRELQENNIAKSISIENIPLYAKTLYETLDGFTTNKLGFSASLDANIDRYGNLNADLHFIRSNFTYSSGKLIDEESLKKLFDTIGNDRRHEDFFILDSEENRKTLVSILKGTIPSLEIRELICETHNSDFVIRNVRVYISNVKEVFGLVFEKDEEYQ